MTETVQRSRISIELVPRDGDVLREELALLTGMFRGFDTINLPDLLRFPLRSWDGCALARAYVPHAIPHIRAMDIDPRQPLPMAETLRRHGLNEILVVTGDPPQDMTRRIYPGDAPTIIRKFKLELPEVKVYAALDPYRSGFRAELDYVQRKLDAGADGFFTQPFFDLRLMEVWGELLEGREVFWGVSPVLSERSQNYWETRNHAVFPHGFQPTPEWNHTFARQVLEWVRRQRAHLYFMPIRVDLRQYLQGILDERATCDG